MKSKRKKFVPFLERLTPDQLAEFGRGMAALRRKFRRRMRRLVFRDDNGKWTGAGDIVRFSYGIPPVTVDAPIIERDGRLIALCPGHNPSECNLRSLRKYVGNWYKQNTQPSGSPAGAGVEKGRA